MFNFLDKHIGVFWLIYFVVAGIWAAYKFRQNLKDKRFKTYHDLIKQLVDEKVPRLDRQIAVIFELKNFPDYYEVSKRILIGLKETWKNADHRILDEIDITLNYINQGKIKRFFRKFVKL